MLTQLRLSDQNLILTGYTGPNQPRVGHIVAERLQMRFEDFEQYIEKRTGDTPEAIRNQYGEQRLKSVVNELMEEIILYRNHVIRVNGSTLLVGEHYQRLQETGPVIVLVARLDAILHRLHVQLGARYHDPSERARALGELQREWFMRKLPGIYELDVTDKDETQTVEAIVRLWQSVAIVRG